MKQPKTWVGLAFILAGIAQAMAQEEKRIDLLEGSSLAAWTDGSGRPVSRGWAVEDGVLHRKERGGDLFTAREFGDFEFEFEWKVAKASNSGVKYRVRQFEGGSWLGPEYQVLDDAFHGDGSSLLTSAGSMYALFPPSEAKKLLPAGEWNVSKIVVRGTALEHWLNGELIVKADTESEAWKEAIAASKFRAVKGFGENRRGRIMLQDHGDEVWFRQLRIRELE
ncbi:MAG TPA: DUF1080 domain-containing protein [Verrucomicrobiales bacterium]|nr:DUF1080 domain-containing protein [Verrucomicrobiales bacterium]